ncbi:hypothetical protein C8R46DRAFT_1043386 [Mycena filopes]|nr:hypothetical protein C8R46DRAFT_1043386 [Mycena filopes]
MQAAVYSTATDVKIHKAIRQEWASFEAWLFEQQKRLERRELQILSAAQRKWGKMKQGDKQEILALRQELVALARRQWLARVRQGLLSLQHWVITPEEKQRLQQTLGWTQKEMIDAWVQQQAELGSMYQRVDPTSLAGHSDLLDSPSRFKHPPERTGPIPAYTNWAAELAKMSAAASSSHKTHSHKPQPHKAQPTRSIKSVDLPSMPLYFVGALLQGTDLDAVAAADLEAFALHASEEKIREYYDAACEASVHFQRVLAAINPAQRDAAHEDFERRMRELASAKEREWKAVTVKELRRYQAAEMEHRAAQQRAMRAPPQRAMRSPPRRPRRRELSEWDYLDEYTSHSPRRDRDPDYSSTYQSSHRDGSRRDDYYPDSYLSPQVDYLHPYHSPPGPLGPDRVEAYHSPRLQRRTNPSRRPPVVEEEEEDYAVSPSVDDNFNPRLRRRNALHRVEEEDYESEQHEHEQHDLYDYDRDPYALSPRAPYEMRALYQEEPLETGLLSTLTKWISKLGTFLSGGKGRADSISSFGWMETNAVDHYGPLPDKHKRNASKSAHTQNHRHRQPKHLDTWAPQPDEEEEDFYESEEELESEEEFPMRRGKSWREKLSWSLPKLRKGKRNRSPTGSDYGWADRDSD